MMKMSKMKKKVKLKKILKKLDNTYSINKIFIFDNQTQYDLAISVAIRIENKGEQTIIHIKENGILPKEKNEKN